MLQDRSKNASKGVQIVGWRAEKSRSGEGLGGSWAAPGSKTTPGRLQRASQAPLGALLGRFGRQVGAKLGPSWRPKGHQNRCKNRCKFEWLLGWVLGGILAGFGAPNGAMLAPKWGSKSMPTSKGNFLKKRCFSAGKTTIFKVQDVEVGAQKRPKIGSDMDAGSNPRF